MIPHINRRLLQGLALCGLLSVASAHAGIATYNITTTWYEPATSPRDSIFIGMFDYDDVTHTITNLKGILSESMSGDRIAYDASAGPGQHDNMTWLGLDNTSNRAWGATQSFMGKTYTEAEILALQQKYHLGKGLDNQLLPSWHDSSLGGTFAITFRNDSSNTFSTAFGGDGWSPQAGADVGGVYYGWPGKASLNPGNAYALIFVPDTLSTGNTTSNPLTLAWHEGQVDQATGEVIEASTGDLGLAYTAYADCVPTVNPVGAYAFGGGMMQAVCMTGTSWDAYGARGTMGGVPYSQTISLAAAVPEPETYALLLAGLGMVAGITRRRKADKASESSSLR